MKSQPLPLLTIASTGGAALFFASIMAASQAYALGAAILLLGGLACLVRIPAARLRRQDTILITLLCAMFGVGLFSYLYHRDIPRVLDLPSRYLLSVPVLLLMLAYPPRRAWVWAGIIAGSALAAGIAAWQLQVLDTGRAMGVTGVIQFGNMGLMLGTFCVAALAEVGSYPRATLWRIACAIGALCGVYTSLASASRGGWLAVPFILIIFALAFINRRNIKYAAGVAGVVIVALVIAAFSIPTIEERYDQAVSDITLYEAGQPNTSLGLRFDMYKSLSAIIPQKPWLGWSTADYAAEQHRLVEEKFVSPVILDMANTHNTFLELWVFQGIFAVVILLALLCWALYQFVRLLRHSDARVQVPAICGASLVVGYTIFSQSQVMLGRNNTLMFFLIALAVMWAWCRPSQADAVSLPQRDS